MNYHQISLVKELVYEQCAKVGEDYIFSIYDPALGREILVSMAVLGKEL